MYTLDELPTVNSRIFGKLNRVDETEICVGVKSGYETIKLFDDARTILQDFYEGRLPFEVKIAAASSADTPRAVEIGRAAMNLIEVFPGITMREVFRKGWPTGFEGNMQIGRTPPLSSNKAQTHFPILQRETQIDYRDMIFFDDCNWGDHVGNVYAAHRVVGQRTPRGLTRREFDLCLRSYAAEVEKNKSKSDAEL